MRFILGIAAVFVWPPPGSARRKSRFARALSNPPRVVPIPRLPAWHAPPVLIRPTGITQTELAALNRFARFQTMCVGVLRRSAPRRTQRRCSPAERKTSAATIEQLGRCKYAERSFAAPCAAQRRRTLRDNFAHGRTCGRLSNEDGGFARERNVSLHVGFLNCWSHLIRTS